MQEDVAVSQPGSIYSAQELHLVVPFSACEIGKGSELIKKQTEGWIKTHSREHASLSSHASHIKRVYKLNLAASI